MTRMERAQTDDDDAFDRALRAAVWVDLRAGRIEPEAVYSSVTNTDWLGPGGEVARLTFRGAGKVIADMLGAGDYTDWYCSATEGDVDSMIAERLLVLGWTHRPTLVD
jgi:hypothetical protein